MLPAALFGLELPGFNLVSKSIRNIRAQAHVSEGTEVHRWRQELDSSSAPPTHELVGSLWDVVGKGFPRRCQFFFCFVLKINLI